MSFHSARPITKTDPKQSTTEKKAGSKNTARTTPTLRSSKNGLPHFNAMPVLIRGVEYQSVRDAAKAIGVSPSAICKALKVTGTADNVGMGNLGAGLGNKNGSKPLTLAGLTFTSRTDAAKKLGVSRSQVTKWISPNASSAQRQMLLAAAMGYHQKKGPQKGSL